MGRSCLELRIFTSKGQQDLTFDFCLYKKHMRSYLASRRSVSGWGHVTNGARALQPNELESSGRVPRKGAILPQSGESAPSSVTQ